MPTNEDLKINIQNGVPLPNRPPISASVRALRVGQSFILPVAHWQALRNSASSAKKTRGENGKLKNFEVHRIKKTDTVGIWRIS